MTDIKSALSGLRQFLPTESPLKMIKNDVYLPQKLFPFLRYLNFCPDFLVMYKNGSIRKIRLISKFMMSEPGKQTIAIHILPNISRSKDNQSDNEIWSVNIM